MRVLRFEGAAAAAMRKGEVSVTRRIGHRFDDAKAGDLLLAVEVVRDRTSTRTPDEVLPIAVVQLTDDPRREPLDDVTSTEIAREGRHRMTATEYVAAFVAAYRCAPHQEVCRLAFAVRERLVGSTPPETIEVLQGYDVQPTRELRRLLGRVPRESTEAVAPDDGGRA